MTGLNFMEVRPDTHSTTPEERLTAFLTKDLRRQYPDRTDVHFHLLAADLAQTFTKLAAHVNLNDYALQLKRPILTDRQLEKLADRN